MKKIVSILLCVTMLITMVAFASADEATEPAPETGDSISAIVALMAVSALALAVVGMKKKEF